MCPMFAMSFKPVHRVSVSVMFVNVSMVHRMLDHSSKYVRLCSCNRFWHQHPKLDYDAFLCRLLMFLHTICWSMVILLYSVLFLQTFVGIGNRVLRCFLIFQTLILDWLTEVYVEWLDYDVSVSISDFNVDSWHI
jgi:hypothetical protein